MQKRKVYHRVYRALRTTGHSHMYSQRIIGAAQESDTKASAMSWIRTITRIVRDWQQGRVD